MSSKNIIEIEGLHKSYSDHKALDNINLSIGESKSKSQDQCNWQEDGGE